jgi:flavin reductase (DIM6/NTAB) family NADH-FMN oxidoreductase RutF
MSEAQLDPGVDPAAGFRAAFRRHASGVAVVTTVHDSRPVGFTATSVVSLSADPPMLSFNLSLGASTWPALSGAQHVAVHMLGGGQVELATRFATSGIDRFAGVPWRVGPGGVPLLAGVTAWLVARVQQRVPTGDHALFVCRVVHTGTAAPARPLVYHEGRFCALPDAALPPPEHALPLAERDA